MLKGKMKNINYHLKYIAVMASVVYLCYVTFPEFWEQMLLVLLGVVVASSGTRPITIALAISIFAGSIHTTLGLKGNVFAIYHDGGVIIYTTRDRDINWQRVKKIKEENSVNSIRLVEKTGTAFMSGK